MADNNQSLLSKMRLGILNTLMPLTQELGKIHAPWTHKKISEEEIYACLHAMKPGMVFSTRTDGELTTLLIPGWWKHSAIVVSQHHIVQAVGRGVVPSGIFDFLMTKDYAVLLAPTFTDMDHMAAAALFAQGQIGAKYDYDFLPPDDPVVLAKEPIKDRAFYCAKLPWAAYRSACGPLVPFETRQTLGVPTVTPDDYVLAVEKWAVVWASASAAPYLQQQRPLLKKP